METILNFLPLFSPFYVYSMAQIMFSVQYSLLTVLTMQTIRFFSYFEKYFISICIIFFRQQTICIKIGIKISMHFSTMNKNSPIELSDLFFFSMWNVLNFWRYIESDVCDLMLIKSLTMIQLSLLKSNYGQTLWITFIKTKLLGNDFFRHYYRCSSIFLGMVLLSRLTCCSFTFNP